MHQTAAVTYNINILRILSVFTTNTLYSRLRIDIIILYVQGINIYDIHDSISTGNNVLYQLTGNLLSFPDITI